MNTLRGCVWGSAVLWFIVLASSWGEYVGPTLLVWPVLVLLIYGTYIMALLIWPRFTAWRETILIGFVVAFIPFLIGVGFSIALPALLWGLGRGIRTLWRNAHGNRVRPAAPAHGR